MEDKATFFIILSLEVDLALLNQVFNTLNLTLSNCVENGSLALRVKEVWITSLLYE